MASTCRSFKKLYAAKERGAIGDVDVTCFSFSASYWTPRLSSITSKDVAPRDEEVAADGAAEELPTIKSEIESEVPQTLAFVVPEYQRAVVVKEEPFEEEAEKKPSRVPTESELKLLRLYSDDMWKFLVAVAFCEKSNMVGEDNLKEFFYKFPDADSVEDAGWFDVQDHLLRWDAFDLTSEELARCIARTSYDYLVLQQEPSVESKGSDVLKSFHRANAFWRSCYDAVFGHEFVMTEVASA